MSTRLYGNWQRPRSAGILGLGTLGSIALFALALVAVLQLMLGGLEAAVLTLAVGGGVLWATAAKDRHGRSAARHALTAVQWSAAKSGRRHLYRSGPVGRTPFGTCSLPGLSASTHLSEWSDGYGRPFALIESRAAGSYSIVFATQPEGAALVDEEQIDSWVRQWGLWLSGLANVAGLEAAAVTIETSPDSGTSLERELRENAHPDAPAFARSVLESIGRLYPEGGASTRAFITLTFRATGSSAASRRRSADEMGRFLAPQVAGLGQGLSDTGAGVVYPLSARELCAVIRIAYDPDVGPSIERMRQAGELPPELTWTEVGPMAHQASWSTYRHDSGLSVTWAMTKAPESAVTAASLASLLQPSPTTARKRVTLLYRPVDVARAARAVHADANAASFNMTTSRNPMARDVQAAQRASKTAAEEAAGAGLLNFGILVTATISDSQARAALEAGEDGFTWLEAEAEAEVVRCAQQAKVQLRRTYGSQDVAFAAALPLGHVLTKHLAVPDYVQEAM